MSKSITTFRILRFLSRGRFYPNGFPMRELKAKFDENIIDEMKYYDWIEPVFDGRIRITVLGRRELSGIISNVSNTALAVAAVVVALLALFFG